MLDIGDGAGALVLRTAPNLSGQEIEIASAETGRRTHVWVLPRIVGSTTLHAAVFGGLPPGDYSVPSDDGTITVRVVAGVVTEVSL